MKNEEECGKKHDPMGIAFLIGFLSFISSFIIFFGLIYNHLDIGGIGGVILSSFIFSYLLSMAWGGIAYSSIEDNVVPSSWLIVTTFVSLFESILFTIEPIRLLFGWWILLPWFLTFATPFILRFLSGTEIEYNLMDREILEVAKKYGGVITATVIVWERSISLENAKKCLERFVREGEARKKVVEGYTIYDFPSVRIYLNKSDKQIIDILVNHPEGLSKVELLHQTGLTSEAIDESIERLVRRGILYEDEISGIYSLRGLRIHYE